MIASKILLDTHALLWWAAGDERLSEKASIAISQSEGVYYSLVNFWEIAIKQSGKGFDFDFPADWQKWLCERAKQYAISECSLSAEHCRCVQDFPFHHRDPFDRMLVAQAKIEGMSILSIDAQLDAYPVERIW